MTMYLFIVCMPYSGSTLLWKIIQSSSSVSALPKEGAQLIKLGRPTFDFVQSPELQFPWDDAKTHWLQLWDTDKSILLEKSPAYIHQADKIREHFSPANFIILVRNPYAFCEGNVRRRRRRGTKCTYEESARLWVRCAESQLQNQHLLENSTLIRYEDLTEHTETTLQKLKDAVPGLGEIKSGQVKTFTVMGRTKKIKNINAAKIGMLSPANIKSINTILAQKTNLMQHYGYEIIASSNSSKLRAMRYKAAARITRLAKWLSRKGVISDKTKNKIHDILI